MGDVAKKRHRTEFTKYQMDCLEQEFNLGHYVDRERRIKLSEHLNLSETIIKVWFQNRRMKHKHQQKESVKNPCAPVYIDYPLAATLYHPSHSVPYYGQMPLHPHRFVQSAAMDPRIYQMQHLNYPSNVVPSMPSTAPKYRGHSLISPVSLSSMQEVRFYAGSIEKIDHNNNNMKSETTSIFKPYVSE